MVLWCFEGKGGENFKVTRYCEHVKDTDRARAEEYVLTLVNYTKGSGNIVCEECPEGGEGGCELTVKRHLTRIDKDEKEVITELNYERKS